MYIDLPDIDYPATSYRLPGIRQPSLWNITINEDMQMGITCLLKLNNRNKGNASLVSSLKIDPKLIPASTDVHYRFIRRTN
jgi:hypothetical protein